MSPAQSGGYGPAGPPSGYGPAGPPSGYGPPGGYGPSAQPGPPGAAYPPETPPYPLPPNSQGELSGSAAAVSVVWALLPLLTFGLATPVAFGFAAWRRWSGWLWAVTAMYALFLGALLALSVAYPEASRTPAAVNRTVGGGLLAVMLGGTAHAFGIRRRVFAPPDAA